MVTPSIETVIRLVVVGDAGQSLHSFPVAVGSVAALTFPITDNFVNANGLAPS
jgi:hypothetical protein